MTFKKGDVVQHKRAMLAEKIFVIQADQVGDLVWAARKGMEQYPSTYGADVFEEIPRTPEKDQVWAMKGWGASTGDYRILNVCGEWVIFGSKEGVDEFKELKYARKVDTFIKRYEYVSG